MPEEEGLALAWTLERVDLSWGQEAEWPREAGGSSKEQVVGLHPAPQPPSFMPSYRASL